jgi:uncharacterized membrane protein
MTKLSVVLVLALSFAAPALARDNPSAKDIASYKGIWLSTPYPALTVAASKPVTIDLKMHNEGLPPQDVTLAVNDLPKGWHAAFLGDGRPVNGVFVSPDATTDLKLRVEPPADLKSGTYKLQLAAKGSDSQADLQLALTLGQVLPQRLTLTPEFPALRGTAGSDFNFKVTLENQSGQDTLVNLTSSAPKDFEVSFTESYGSQQLTTIPLKAGQSKDLSVKINPPHDVAAGQYAVDVHAAAEGASADTKLALDVTGRPSLVLSGPEGLVSGQAYAGEETAMQLTVANTGSAPADTVELSSSEPSGWKVTFQPTKIDHLSPGGKREIKAMITPASKALAGDYMVTLSANAGGASKSQDFRIAVMTSTLWGVVGLAVIAAALVVVGLAVMRYGRR